MSPEVLLAILARQNCFSVSEAIDIRKRPGGYFVVDLDDEDDGQTGPFATVAEAIAGALTLSSSRVMVAVR